ncbi:MAG: hypothetical protein HONBIEJF_01886 [Fimbriimonadaceae bacterium]|nr:hypothetical protein [Fimbriimonadaceae bacterium]
MSIFAFALAVSTAQPFAIPALWLTTDGQILIDGKECAYRADAPTKKLARNGNFVWDFQPGRGGIYLGDHPALAMTGSITVSTNIFLRSYVNEGPGAQILFRGDDRNGHDPYTLVVHGDVIEFGIQNEHDRGRCVFAEVELNKWYHVLANFDSRTGYLEMWLNGEFVGGGKTQFRPFAQLEVGEAPGVSIGNVQNNLGRHNQPLNGIISDLRLYRQVMRPRDLQLTR